MKSLISSLVRIWKIRNLSPWCSFEWILRVVYFPVEHSRLYNKRLNSLYHCHLCVFSVAITSPFTLPLKTVLHSILSAWHDKILCFTHLSGVNIVYLTDCLALTADRFLLLPELVGDNRGLGTSATKQQWKNQKPLNNSQKYNITFKVPLWLKSHLFYQSHLKINK